MIVSLLAADLAETLAFYLSLGFHISGEWRDEESQWAEVSRDAVALQFFTTPPANVPDKPVLSGTIYFFSDDVRALAKEIKARWTSHGGRR